MKVMLFACMIILLQCAGVATAKGAVAVWTTSSLEKVMKHGPIKPLEPAVISAAGNEHEAFQVVLRAGREGSTGITVSMGPLKSANSTIPASNINAYLPHYVYLPKYADYYPDALPPYNGPFDLKPGDTQPVWVDVNVPKDTKPGDYSGVVKINAGSEELASVPVKLKVYNFNLPIEPKLTTAFGIHGHLIANAHGVQPGSPEANVLYRKYYDFLLDHGISAYDIPGDIMSDEWAKYAKDPRVTSFRIGFSEDEEELKKNLDRVRSLGVWDKGYLYFVDEPKTEDNYKRLWSLCDYVKKVDPKANIVSPYWCDPDYVKGKTAYDLLKGYINIWCFNTGYYNEKELTERRNAGEKIWNYICCGPGRPNANFFVDYAPLEHRMLFWQNYLMQVSGLLYWTTTFWDPRFTKDAWEDIATVKDINPELYGDGTLMYPGKKVGIDGPVSSIRLEVVRDGIEDYKYLWLLEQKAGRDAVLPYVEKLTTSWTDYTKDPVLFKSVRDEIAHKIEESSSPAAKK